jgi:hypothetical protein
VPEGLQAKKGPRSISTVGGENINPSMMYLPEVDFSKLTQAEQMQFFMQQMQTQQMMQQKWLMQMMASKQRKENTHMPLNQDSGRDPNGMTGGSGNYIEDEDQTEGRNNDSQMHPFNSAVAYPLTPTSLTPNKVDGSPLINSEGNARPTHHAMNFMPNQDPMFRQIQTISTDGVRTLSNNGRIVVHGTILDSIDSPRKSDDEEDQEERKVGVTLAKKFNKLHESMSEKGEQETAAIMIEEESKADDPKVEELNLPP